MSGAERIGAAFAAARSEGRAALMPYMMGGFPDDETAASVAGAYADAGADLVELGVPFSDPLADGPVIHAAATQALAAGATFDGVLEIGATIAERVPVIAMAYANMLLARGVAEFAARSAEAGLAGLIVPDLPPEEAAPARSALNEHGLALVPLVAPTTPDGRRRTICAEAQGFVYLVSDTRTTGERDDLPPALADLIAATKRDSEVPVAVGFGIGTAEQAAAVGAVADGVIVGSRLVRAVGEAGERSQAAIAVADFIAGARATMSRSAVG
jgi:tryptophan synthase alpha chain